MTRPDTILTLAEAAAQLDPARPVIVSDADEVLLQFVAGLEIFLATKGCRLDLTSFALQGNVKRIATDEPISKVEMADFLRLFFETVDDLQAVSGAPTALRTLGTRAQVLVLSNVPAHTAENRRRNLTRLGIHAPLVANDGLKGKAIQTLKATSTAPMFFLDDLPPHLASVADLCPDIHLIHFVAHPKLAAVVPHTPKAHLRTSDWSEAESWISARLPGA